MIENNALLCQPSLAIIMNNDIVTLDIMFFYPTKAYHILSLYENDFCMGQSEADSPIY